MNLKSWWRLLKMKCSTLTFLLNLSNLDYFVFSTFFFTFKFNFLIYFHIYIYIYIYCHPQTDCLVASQLFSVARHARFPKLGSRPGWLKFQSKILPLSLKETSANEGNLNAYVSHLLCLHISTQLLPRAQFIWRALLYAMAIIFFHHYRSQSHRGRGAYIYIYIYIYREREREREIYIWGWPRYSHGMRPTEGFFFFQYGLPCGPHTSFIGFEVLGYH